MMARKSARCLAMDLAELQKSVANGLVVYKWQKIHKIDFETFVRQYTQEKLRFGR